MQYAVSQNGETQFLNIWKGKYMYVVISIETLSVKRRERPLLLRESLDNEVKSYLGHIRKGGGVITALIISNGATANVRWRDKTLLVKNGCHLQLTTDWQCQVYTAVKLPWNNVELKQQFLLDIVTVVAM